MMSCWTKQLKHAALSGALGLVVLAACAQESARAQEDDSNSIWNMERRIWGGFMRSLGLRSADDADIEFRERSPLVVPPSRELPPPEAAGTRRDPAWPTDPDVKRRQEATAKRRQPGAGGYNPEEASRHLTPSELNKGRGAGRSGTGSGSLDAQGNPVAPSALGYIGGLFSGSAFGFGGSRDEVGTFTQEPPRTNLTAPPAGYQTPSPAQPYGTTRRYEHEKPMKTEDIPVGRGY